MSDLTKASTDLQDLKEHTCQNIFSQNYEINKAEIN
jgi:hypothetical protein